jgi:hypothetical protein
MQVSGATRAKVNARHLDGTPAAPYRRGNVHEPEEEKCAPP